MDRIIIFFAGIGGIFSFRDDARSYPKVERALSGYWKNIYSNIMQSMKNNNPHQQNEREING